MRMEGLRKMNERELRSRLGELGLELTKADGYRKIFKGGFSKKYPNYSNLKKEIAQIHTILGERK